MPIEIKLVVYHHKGEPDLYEPHVICDHCCDRVMDAKDGLGLWHVRNDGSTDGKLYFVHKRCVRAFERQHGAAFSMSLGRFIKYITNNLCWAG